MCSSKIATLVQYLGMGNSSTNVGKMHYIYFLTESMIFTSLLKLWERQALQISFWNTTVMLPHSVQGLNSFVLAFGSWAISVSVSHSSILFLPNHCRLIYSAVHNPSRLVESRSQKHCDEVTV